MQLSVARSSSLNTAAERGDLDRTLVVALVVLATLAAALLRLPFLGRQSLWLDEIFTSRILAEPSLIGVWHHVRLTESTPPLYYVLAWLAGGRSAAAMRLIPACALIASVPVAFLAFRRAIGERAALAAAAVVAVSPMLVEYALDARAYGVFVLSALVSVWALFSVLERGSRRRWVAWASAALACVWSHYFGFFLVAGEVVVLVVHASRRSAVLAPSLVVLLGSLPLAPLLSAQSGDDRAAFIGASSLQGRLVDTVRQFAMGANVPRTWLEAAGIAVALAAIVLGALIAVRSESRARALLVLAAGAIGIPLVLAALGIEDRVYTRNLLFAVPLLAAVAAPALLRLRAVALGVYLSLATLASLWVVTDWRYQQTDWHGALSRAAAIDPSAGVIAVPQSPYSALVAGTYLGRAPLTAPVLARRVWLVVEPFRAPHHRALGQAPAPVAARAALAGFTAVRTVTVHGFRETLYASGAPALLSPAGFPGAAVFAPR